MKYSFTTTAQDLFVNRILEEALPNQKVLVTQMKDTYGSDHRVIVAIRQEIVNKMDCRVKLGGKVLSTRWGYGMPGFRVLEIPTSNLARTTERVRHEGRRLLNLLSGRTIRVAVESL